VAVHFAVQSLLRGECDVALAGGVTIRVPQLQGYYYDEGGIMPPDARTRTFDAAAKGAVFGSGCGVVVLKRLDDALGDGDVIDTVILGSAVNNDGGLKAGFTAPSVSGQAAVIAEAQEVAGVPADTIELVEAHGTATPLGDPIELAALQQAYREVTRRVGFCAVGSVKSNVGHLETAAGVCGLIKAAMAVRTATLPATIHFETPNPHFDFASSPFWVNTRTRPWPAVDHPRRAGVSAFGLGGTNAHVILEEPPRRPGRPRAPVPRPLILPVSAKSERALAALAAAWADQLDAGNAELGGACASAALRRPHHRHRLAVVGESCDDLSVRLRAFAAGEAHAGVASGQVEGGAPPRVVFVFPGQGGQWLGMGRDLYDHEPAFASALDACDAAIERAAGWSVREELAADLPRSRLERVDVVQPTLFAMQVGLTTLWRARGVEPVAVIGHSMGEVAAACVAGALSVDDAARIICGRSRLVKEASGRGAMAVVELSESELEARLRRHGGAAVVAAANGPTTSIVSADPDAMAIVLEELEREGIFCRRIKVDYASHGPQMAPLLPRLAAALAGLEPRVASIRMLSTVIGRYVRGDELTATYWCDNLRRRVDFHRGISQLLDEGAGAFVEISPHPSILPAVGDAIGASGKRAIAVGSLARDVRDRDAFYENLARLHVAGVPVDWGWLDPGAPFARPPTYPWQRRAHWVGGQGVGYDVRQRREVAFDDLAAAFYEPVWRRTAGRPSHPKRGSGAYLVVPSGPSATAALLAVRIRRAGDICIVVGDGAGGAHWGSPDRLREALGRFDAHADPLSAVVFVHEPRAGADASLGEGDLSTMLAGPLHLARALARRDAAAPPKLVFATRGAQRVLPCDRVPDPIGAAIWGLCMNLGQEHPELAPTAVDLDPEGGPGEDALWGELGAECWTSEVAYRGSTRYEAEVVPSPSPPSAGVGGRLRRDRTYLVTGGFGALGLRTAQWLERRGARHVALLGRRPPSAAAAAVIDELRARGVNVLAGEVDVTDAGALARVLEAIDAGAAPLAGVLHLASHAGDGVVLDLELSRFLDAVRPKVLGALNLHRATLERDLEFFVLFSSVVSLAGSHGQAAYTAANRVLDALAHHRRARGLAAVSVNWGAWLQPEKDARVADIDRRLQGLDRFDPELGFEALGRILHADRAQLGFVPGLRVRALLRRSPRLLALPLYRSLASADEPREAEGPAPTIRDELRAARDPGDAMQLLEDALRRAIAQILKIPRASIAADAPFASLGLTSLLGLELRRDLEVALGIRLTATMIYNYPTLDRLVPLLASKVGVAAEVGPAAAAALGNIDEETVAGLSEEAIEHLLDRRLEALGDRLATEGS
jgi:pimaricinolide synthase PimS2